MSYARAQDANFVSSTRDRYSDLAVSRRLNKLSLDFHRAYERRLRGDRPRLFKALAEFANVRPDRKAWSHFRKRWPDFFPTVEYERAENDSSRSVRGYVVWLNEVWLGNTASFLQLLGIKAEPKIPGDVSPVLDIHLIPAQFFADWDERTFRYRALCDFQQALYLLFQESWRARVCKSCSAKFIAKRATSVYCTTDCSDGAKRELKRNWWARNGGKWRRERKVRKLKKAKGEKNGTRQMR